MGQKCSQNHPTNLEETMKQKNKSKSGNEVKP
jgi:hypothetical protein